MNPVRRYLLLRVAASSNLPVNNGRPAGRASRQPRVAGYLSSLARTCPTPSTLDACSTTLPAVSVRSWPQGKRCPQRSGNSCFRSSADCASSAGVLALQPIAASFQTISFPSLGSASSFLATPCQPAKRAMSRVAKRTGIRFCEAGFWVMLRRKPLPSRPIWRGTANIHHPSKLRFRPRSRSPTKRYFGSDRLSSIKLASCMCMRRRDVEVRANPSLHPTRYSGLRPLPTNTSPTW